MTTMQSTRPFRDAPDYDADENIIEVGIGELAVAEAPRILMTPALGSCVGVAILDPYSHRGGLAHVMLPVAAGEVTEFEGRFADRAVPELVRRLSDAGSIRRRLMAKIAGGAAMFRFESGAAHIGERNVAEVKRQLEVLGIPLVGEDTGESHARTVELVLTTGEFVIRSYQFGVTRL